MEGWARKLVAAIRGETEEYNGRNQSHLITSELSSPDDQRGTELIFHGFSRPPPHSPPQQTTRSPPPRPCAPPTVSRHIPLHTGWSDTKFSATSGRKISIVTAPLVITPHLCFSCQDVRNLIFSLLFSSIKTVEPCHKTAWCVQTAVMPWKEDRRLLSSSCMHLGSSSSKLIL